MPRTLRFIAAGSALSALALGGCTPNVEADVESLCAALTEVVEHPEFAAMPEDDREPLLLVTMADAIETRQLVDFMVELDDVARPERPAALEAFAAEHGFEWNCAAFDQYFVAEQVEASPEPSGDAADEAPAVAEEPATPPVDAALANVGQAADLAGDGSGDPAGEAVAAEGAAADGAVEAGTGEDNAEGSAAAENGNGAPSEEPTEGSDQ